MGVENIFPSLKIPILAKRKPISLEGSFNHAFQIFDTLPTTCPHIGDRDFSCGRAKLVLSESVSGLFGLNGNGTQEQEIFLAAHQPNDELERQALILLILVKVGGKRIAFKIEGTSRQEKQIEDIGWEVISREIKINDRRVFLYTDSEKEGREVLPGSLEFKAFGSLLGLARQIKKEPMSLLCGGCTAKKYRLPRPEV